MQPSSPNSPADARFVERMLEALEAGAAADADVLARVVGADVVEVAAALRAMVDYRAMVETARSGHEGTTRGEDLAPGHRIADFVIESVLGRGAMGVVYRARQGALGGRTVALKVLPRALVARDARFVERFRREAELAAKIHHPNLAAVYGFDSSTEDVCFAMRLVEGPTLHEVLVILSRGHAGAVRATPVEHVRRSVRLARGVADALSAVHARGLVHRDVKPSNVLLEGAQTRGAEALTAVPVLVDFGLLRPAGQGELTGTRTLLGTPAYASFECQLGQQLDARTDVFSLAVTLFDLLTTTLPGSRGLATAGLPDVRAINPNVDARLAAVLAMAMHPRKELRYEHGAALRDELDRWLAGGDLRAMPARALGKIRLWIRREPTRALRLGFMLLLPVAAVSMLVLWFAAATWSLTAADRAAARCEAEGDMLGAAAAYRELFNAGGQARVLPWLADGVQRAHLYWNHGSKLATATERLSKAAALLDDASPASAVEPEFAVGNQLLCELLLDEPNGPSSAAILAFLMREARSDVELRQRAALDALTNYLIAQDSPQVVPRGLEELLWSRIAAHPRPAQPETRQAAVAALGAIRSVEVLEKLFPLLTDADREVARLANVCSFHVYRWLHATNPGAHARVTASTLEAWGRAVDAQASMLGDDHVSRSEDKIATAAEHLAWWELMHDERGDLPRLLALPPRVREAVDRSKPDLAAKRAARDSSETFQVVSGRLPSRYDAAIWKWQRGEDTPELLATGDPGRARDVFHGRFEVEPVPGEAPEAVVTGTLSRAEMQAATVVPWESTARKGYVRFARPGHSRLRLRSAVPATASDLTIRVVQMKGGRSILRGGGNLVLRYSLTDLLWQHVEEGPDGSDPPGRPRRGVEDGNATTTLHVPAKVFAKVDELEFVVEYLYGNTSHRVLRVDFEWEPSVK